MSSRPWVYAGLGLAAIGSAIGLVRFMQGPRLSSRSRVFLFGDSLAVGLAPHLKSLFDESKVPFAQVSKSGTRLDQWANSQVLQSKLQEFEPTIILVSLGTNDEYMPGDAPSKQQPYLEQLIENVSPYGEIVWIGPPTLPKSSNGIVPMLKDTLPRSHYFASDALQIPRGPDGIHPTARGYAAWAGSIWRWLS
jgi:lysophospholipase L1-like esterase